MIHTIIDTCNYNECMKYINDLEHFYIGTKLSQVKSERIKQTLQKFCRERTYDNTFSNVEISSSVNVLGDSTLNTIIKSPIEPSLANPFPLIIFSSRF